jgi:predicted flap endonuclease-1-like 5' DNA nuclease
MIYLIQTFALPLAAALIGGIAVGWVTSDKEDEGPSGWAALAITALALMVVASALKWLPGRPGLWLDTAILFSGAYLAGCLTGAFARVFTDKVEEMVTEPLTQAVGAGQAFAATLEPAKAMATAASDVANATLARVGEAPASSEPAAPVQRAASTPPEAPPASTPQRAAEPARAPTGAAAAAEAMAEGTKPTGLSTARGNKPDELELIRGIGPQNEARLHALGVWHFDQIAAWTAKEAQWVGGYLAFPGRIEREDWIGQAKVLAAGGTTDHADKVKRGDISSTRDEPPGS